MTQLQQELARQLRIAVAGTDSERIVFKTEYLGYLPFGQYQWVTVAGKDVSLTFPDGWEWRDLEVLADAGTLVRISKWVNPLDDSERESQYELPLGINE